MHSFKNIAILITLLSCVSLSFTSRKSVKLNKLINQINAFYPSLLDENNNLSVKKCNEFSDKIEALNDRIAMISLQRSTEGAQKMLFVHAFNLQVLKKINLYYPLKSIEEIDDFYDGESFTVSKGQYTLRSLKHYLIAKYKDPQVFFSMYFGGLTAPRLTFPKEKKSERLILLKAKQFVNKKENVRIKARSHLLLLPEFMKWYIKDFNIENPQDFIPYLNGLLESEKIPDNYEVKFYPYSWKLD